MVCAGGPRETLERGATMSFKVMAICAGRHGGNGEILAKEALCAVKEAGGEVELVNLFDYDILPCTGCEGCTMQMGRVGAGLQKEYHGCVLKDKDDVDALVSEMHTCQGIIFAVPTYDLVPSSLYTRFAQRFLAYELSFLLAIGVVKENPHTVAGLISVGGSMHDWQSLALESLQATMFTMSLTVVDRFLAQRDGRPGNALVWEDQIPRARKMGENIVRAIQTPVEERVWLGDPDDGVCPNCHSSLVYPGDKHWDGVEFPWECAVCGAGGDLVIDEKTGRPRLAIAENGLIRDRNNDAARAEHLNEINQTRDDFFSRLDEVKPLMERYAQMEFPTLKIERA